MHPKRTLALTLLTCAVTIVFVGCTTTSGEGGSTTQPTTAPATQPSGNQGGGGLPPEMPKEDIHYAGYTISVPIDAEIYTSMRPLGEMDAGISPTPTYRSRAVYPSSMVIRIPDRRGHLVFYDPDTECSVHGYNECLVLFHSDMVGCPRQGHVNGLDATEVKGGTTDGVYWRKVHYDACGIVSPAGLIGHYEDASWATRHIFDQIVESVRR